MEMKVYQPFYGIVRDIDRGTEREAQVIRLGL
jgi:hypothetical protein